MGFDIKDLHIENDSPEGRALERIIAKEGVTPEEAVRRALRRADDTKTPAERAWGLFSSPEDAALMDDVMEIAKNNRRIDAEGFARRWE